ncbi:hypothetical protein Tco_0670071 [Tanacetum coccineum]
MTTSKPTKFNWHEIDFKRIFSIEASDKDIKLLSAPESNNTLTKCLDLRESIPVPTLACWASELQHVGTSHGLNVGLLALICVLSFLTTGMANHCHWELITSCGWFLASHRPTSLLSSVLLSTIIVTIIGVAVVVVAAGAVVESSSVVKLSFVVTRYLHWSMLSYLIH